MKNQNKHSVFSPGINRRTFIKSSASAALGFTVIPSYVLGGKGIIPPSDKITLGIIGVGGQGIYDMKRFLDLPDIQVVSVSDPMEKWDYSEWWYGDFAGREPAKQVVNDFYAQNAPSGNYEGCTSYADFREMLEKEELNAVLVASTDHIHAVASMEAMKRGLHVYCEKPLTHSVHEAHMLAEAAKKYNVATQMGNQGQAGEEPRRVAEYIMDGALGQVHEVHDWTDRPIWPQGMDRPKEEPPVPEVLDWDLWLGPAPERPYHPSYISVRWRGWVDFGTGALGDMGCHSFDPIFRAIKLGHPISVEGSYSQIVEPNLKRRPIKESYPVASIVRYEFSARDEMPPVTLTWYDGGLKPPRPEELEEGRELRSNGILYVGESGKMLDNRLIPNSLMESYTPPPQTLPRSPGHYQEWVRAMKGGEPAGSNFEFASMVTEVVLLGNIALRRGKKLYWDGVNMKFTNDEEANTLLHRQYREGWTL